MPGVHNERKGTQLCNAAMLCPVCPGCVLGSEGLRQAANLKSSKAKAKVPKPDPSKVTATPQSSAAVTADASDAAWPVPRASAGGRTLDTSQSTAPRPTRCTAPTRLHDPVGRYGGGRGARKENGLLQSSNIPQLTVKWRVCFG